ncbi:porin [Piscinibacter terrae]|uniref:Porin n=1 Tax=Piscinibacter terrae TaxID=2496871 RepID=A0A3N7HVR6_9BURK|nr:porin [Albitalea terrae]RQP26407.1 porin [Albitalea terrae]
MKKSLLALAVLGAFAGAASAQSSVTIYGSLDLAVTKGNGGTAPNNSANGTSKAWIEKQSNGSRLGFRGNEDLGGGLSAQFQIEHRFNPDEGVLNNPSFFWQGRSYVQLSSATAGRVYLGRDYTPAFWPAVKSDPFGWDGVGQAGSTMWAGFLTPANAGGTAAASGVRASNTVGYKSPNLSGLTAQVAVALGERVVGRDTGFNVEYSGGPIYAAFGYEGITGGPTASVDGNRLINLALHYDLGMVKPIFYYSRAKVNAGTATPLTNKYWMLGALAPIGGGTLKAAYGRLTPDANTPAPVSAPWSNQTQSKLGLGYDYPLSKRTNVYADMGMGRATNATNNTAYAVGVKHTF